MVNKEDFCNKRDFLAYNLSQCRRLKGLTQEELSELCGISVDTLRSWEKKRAYPNSNNMDTLSDVLEWNFTQQYEDSCDYNYLLKLEPTLNDLGFEVCIGFVGNSRNIIRAFKTENGFLDYYIAYNQSIDAKIRFYNENNDSFDYDAMLDYLLDENTMVSFPNRYFSDIVSFMLGHDFVSDKGTHILLRNNGHEIVLTKDELKEFYDCVLNHKQVLKKVLT